MIFDFYGADDLSEREQSIVDENIRLQKENDMLVEKLKQIKTTIDLFCEFSDCDDCENCRLFKL